MDVSTVAGNVSALSAAQAADQAGVAVLKMALDAEAQASLALIAALPPLQNLPPNLGKRIDTIA